MIFSKIFGIKRHGENRKKMKRLDQNNFVNIGHEYDQKNLDASGIEFPEAYRGRALAFLNADA